MTFSTNKFYVFYSLNSAIIIFIARAFLILAVYMWTKIISLKIIFYWFTFSYLSVFNTVLKRNFNLCDLIALTILGFTIIMIYIKFYKNTYKILIFFSPFLYFKILMLIKLLFFKTCKIFLFLIKSCFLFYCWTIKNSIFNLVKIFNYTSICSFSIILYCIKKETSLDITYPILLFFLCLVLRQKYKNGLFDFEEYLTSISYLFIKIFMRYCFTTLGFWFYLIYFLFLMMLYKVSKPVFRTFFIMRFSFFFKAKPKVDNPPNTIVIHYHVYQHVTIIQNNLESVNTPVVPLNNEIKAAENLASSNYVTIVDKLDNIRNYSTINENDILGKTRRNLDLVKNVNQLEIKRNSHLKIPLPLLPKEVKLGIKDESIPFIDSDSVERFPMEKEHTYAKISKKEL